MGARAERKARRIVKVNDYKEKIENAFYEYMDTCSAIPTEDEIEGARTAYRKEVIALVTACPQEKMLIVEGYHAFIKAVTEKADELRDMTDKEFLDDLPEEGDAYE